MPNSQDKSSPQREDASQAPVPPPIMNTVQPDVLSGAANDSVASRQPPRNATPTSINYCAAAGYQTRKPKPANATHDATAVNFAKMCYNVYSDDLQTVQEVKAHSDWPQWKTAIDAEIGQLDCLGTYKLVELPEGQKAIGCKRVFAIKQNTDREIVKYKARLVAQGFSQQPGLDYFETYAPVGRAKSLRAIVAIAALLGLDIHQLDVVGAYLHSDLEEVIYVKQPPEYNDRTGRVWLLLKALYGLKQAANAWNVKLNSVFMALYFRRLTADLCVYVYDMPDGLVIVIIHVDDMAVARSNTTLLTHVKKQIASQIKVTDLGQIKKYIGIQFDIDPARSMYRIYQASYIATILEHFGMQESKPVHTPLEPDVHLVVTSPDVLPDADYLYPATIGSLIYEAVNTGPDITFSDLHR